MTTQASWADFMRGSDAERPVQPSHASAPFYRSWETWVTFSLVLVAFLAVTASIEQADWVDEMPSLFAAALIGIVGGFVLAHVRAPGALLVPLATVVGIVVSFALTMQTMALTDPLLGTGLRARWDDLWARLDAWGAALVDGNISTDPLPFILVVVFASWALSFLAAWSVFRWHNAWLAVIPGGFALLTNISYLPGQPSLALVVYLFAAMLLVTRLQALHAEEDWVRERTVRPPFLSLEVLNVATWLGLVLIVAAWLLPTANNWGPVADAWQRALSPVTERVDRLGRLFIGIDAKRADIVHNFGDILPLQGRIKLSEDPLFRVTAPDDVPLLRAAVYDEYTGNGWRVSSGGTVALEGTSVDAASFGTPATRSQFRRPVVVDITLERTLSERRLLTPGEPLAADVDASLLVGGAEADVLGLVPDDRVRAEDSYTTVGTISAATVDTLAAAGTNYPVWVRERYLQLPADLPPEVGALAATVTDGSTNPYVRARRIEEFLRAEYPFDLEIADPSPLEDGVAYFLFESRRGYFDQHASAMAVMLRTLGVPARVAVGYALDPRDIDPETKAYVVSDLRAWAWPEVYFEGLGWVEFNPTPGRALVQRPGDDSAFGGVELEFDDPFLAGEALLFDEAELDGAIGTISGGPTVVAEEESPLSGVGSAVARLLAFLLLVGAVLTVAVVAVRVAWELRYRRLGPAAKRWAVLQDLAALAGIDARSHLTANEAARAVDRAAGLDGTVSRLGRAYSRERYGAPLSDEAAGASDDEELAHSYRTARNRLVRMALSRLVPRRRRRRAIPA
ncbi:MAG: transglutaminase domain-containing protein [Dehalococcoidia bacterium]